jgi:uncharacterized membrane protein YqjE
MNMDEPRREEAARGLFGSLRTLLDRVLALLQTRTELITTELEEEVTRLVGVLLWSFAAVLAAVIGACFIGVVVLLVVPESYRPLAAGVLAVLFLGFAAFGYVSIRRIAAAKPRLFDASLTELEKDREQLRGDR